MREIREYQIEYNQFKLKFLNLGAVITEYSYNGQNVVLEFEEKTSYLNNNTYLGSVVGRSAGRIRDGEIDGWQLPKNQDGKHNLHGNALHYKFYEVETKENQATLTLKDPEEDFPGNAIIQIKYLLTDDGLVQEINATSDKPTVFNMTNHSYFNLNGGGPILDHQLQIEAKQVLELDIDSLPIGIINTAGTAFDFNQPKLIGAAKAQGHSQFEYTDFIDHPFKLDGQIKLTGDKLQLEIETDQDFVVVYCGNFLGDEVNPIKGGMNKQYHAICLETQHAPGTTNLETEYSSKTKYKISALDF